MLKTLSAYIGEYKRVSIKTPIYIIVEVLMEILIPLLEFRQENMRLWPLPDLHVT